MIASQDKKFLSLLGERLKGIRKAWGVTQKEMAQRLSVSLTSYQHYERGEREVPSTFVNRLSACGVSPLWFIVGKGPMSLEKLEAQNLIRVEAGPLSEIIHFLKDFWDQANDKERAWLEVQFERCFPEFRFSIKKHQPKKEGTNDTDVA